MASTFPSRSSVSDRPHSRITDIEPPVVSRRSADTGLSAKYAGPEADESGSDSEREPEVEELAQNSDSAVGKWPTLVIKSSLRCSLQQIHTSNLSARVYLLPSPLRR